ncbi:MAG: choline-sulfatase [Planctomycetota bacterium]|jgi:choline-sulfatase
MLFRLSSRGTPIAALLIPICFVAVSCDSRRTDSERLNVLMIVIDTARADKFGCYGHSGGLTPHVDRLAAQGARFERASAHAPWTLPSTASLLSSLHPEEHGAGGFLDLSALATGGEPRVAFHGLPDAVETVAEAFKAGGWRTGAVVNVDFLSRDFGLTQGIDDLDAKWYESNEEVRSATQTTDKAIEWIQQRKDEPFFLLAHYFDAHAVYSPPEEYRREFAAAQDREQSNFVFGTRAHMLMLRAGKLELDEDLIERAEKLYEAELAYVDAQVGRLLAGLKAAGLDQNTLVVLTADHGEEFLDHQGFEHGHTLYEELLSVPLIFRLPELIPAGTQVKGATGLVDVAPTLCELAGIQAPSTFVGRSLVPALNGSPLGKHSILAHGNFWGEPLTSWQSGPWKLILTPQPNRTQRTELFNLEEDPRELNDLTASLPQVVVELHAEYAAVREHLRAAQHGEKVKLSDDLMKRLQGLGYLGSTDDSEEDDE